MPWTLTLPGFCTLLLETDTDLGYIHELLGHKTSKTTETHTHVSEWNIGRIKEAIGYIEKGDNEVRKK